MSLSTGAECNLNRVGQGLRERGFVAVSFRWLSKSGISQQRSRWRNFMGAPAQATRRFWGRQRPAPVGIDAGTGYDQSGIGH